MKIIDHTNAIIHVHYQGSAVTIDGHEYLPGETATVKKGIHSIASASASANIQPLYLANSGSVDPLITAITDTASNVAIWCDVLVV